MSASLSAADAARPARLGWVDVGKGLCILLVVTMHSTLGVGEAIGREGFMHDFVAFTKPFRMPDFFLLSGFLAASTLNWPWKQFADRKIIHFIYFYVLWLAILVVLKSAALGLGSLEAGARFFLMSLVEPFSTLWFIHVLPLFFLVARWSRGLPIWLVLGLAAGLHALAAMQPDGLPYAMASKWTGWFAIDSFALFLVYFLVGVRLSSQIRHFAGWVGERPLAAFVVLGVWLGTHTVFWQMGLSDIAGLTLVLGLAGAFAVLAIAVLLSRTVLATPFAICGRQSLVIYLAFVIPMVGMREVLVRTGFSTLDAGILSLIVAGSAAIGPLVAATIARRIGLRFLFERPLWAHLRS
jgi:uncharacterized membrane protein YcfT